MIALGAERPSSPAPAQHLFRHVDADDLGAAPRDLTRQKTWSAGDIEHLPAADIAKHVEHAGIENVVEEGELTFSKRVVVPLRQSMEAGRLAWTIMESVRER